MGRRSHEGIQCSRNPSTKAITLVRCRSQSRTRCSRSCWAVGFEPSGRRVRDCDISRTDFIHTLGTEGGSPTRNVSSLSTEPGTTTSWTGMLRVMRSVCFSLGWDWPCTMPAHGDLRARDTRSSSNPSHRTSFFDRESKAWPWATADGPHPGWVAQTDPRLGHNREAWFAGAPRTPSALAP